MQPLPHIYSVTAAAAAAGIVELSADGLPDLRSSAPAQFGGPGDLWSPESLLAGAVASCFILSFRYVARASHLKWVSLECDVDATLDRSEHTTQFVKVVVRARLIVPETMDAAFCERALKKAEHGCLVANSLRCERELQIEVLRVPVRQSATALA
ncbi:MAG TPA: OsmC family protein [Steroidobacteraceae bacterium]|nr:OsmC family protein [Steroidobacteraceae bacterium]